MNTLNTLLEGPGSFCPVRHLNKLADRLADTFSSCNLGSFLLLGRQVLRPVRVPGIIHLRPVAALLVMDEEAPAKKQCGSATVRS